MDCYRIMPSQSFVRNVKPWSYPLAVNTSGLLNASVSTRQTVFPTDDILTGALDGRYMLTTGTLPHPVFFLSVFAVLRCPQRVVVVSRARRNGTARFRVCEGRTSNLFWNLSIQFHLW